MTRRTFLGRAAASALGVTVGAAAPAWARRNRPEEALTQKEQDLRDLAQYDFVMPRVQFACETGVQDYWHVRPGGDANLLRRLSEVMHCRTKPIEGTSGWEPSRAGEGQLNAVVTLDDAERMQRFPFLFMTGESRYRLSPAHRESMRAYLERGGFIFMDDCMARPGSDHFFQSSIVLMQELFGAAAVRRVPNSHEIFSNVYDYSEIGLPYLNGVEHGAHGVFLGDRLAVLLSSHDLHCGWSDSAGRIFRGQRLPAQGIGPHVHRHAIEMGINIIMYAMTH